jgi:hypothetical protein
MGLEDLALRVKRDRRPFCVLPFCRDSIDRNFELGACTKGHHSPWRDHDVLAGLWISSFARSLAPHGERAKVGDSEGFSLLQVCLEEFKNPIQERGRVFFRDPGFLMDAVSDLNLSHLVLLPLRQGDTSPPKTLGPVHQ